MTNNSENLDIRSENTDLRKEPLPLLNRATMLLSLACFQSFGCREAEPIPTSEPRHTIANETVSTSTHERQRPNLDDLQTTEWAKPISYGNRFMIPLGDNGAVRNIRLFHTESAQQNSSNVYSYLDFSIMTRGLSVSADDLIVKSEGGKTTAQITLTPQVNNFKEFAELIYKDLKEAAIMPISYDTVKVGYRIKEGPTYLLDSKSSLTDIAGSPMDFQFDMNDNEWRRFKEAFDRGEASFSVIVMTQAVEVKYARFRTDVSSEIARVIEQEIGQYDNGSGLLFQKEAEKVLSIISNKLKTYVQASHPEMMSLVDLQISNLAALQLFSSVEVERDVVAQLTQSDPKFHALAERLLPLLQETIDTEAKFQNEALRNLMQRLTQDTESFGLSLKGYLEGAVIGADLGLESTDQTLFAEMLEEVTGWKTVNTEHERSYDAKTFSFARLNPHAYKGNFEHIFDLAVIFDSVDGIYRKDRIDRDYTNIRINKAIQAEIERLNPEPPEKEAPNINDYYLDFSKSTLSGTCTLEATYHGGSNPGIDHPTTLDAVGLVVGWKNFSNEPGGNSSIQNPGERVKTSFQIDGLSHVIVPGDISFAISVRGRYHQIPTTRIFRGQSEEHFVSTRALEQKWRQANKNRPMEEWNNPIIIDLPTFEVPLHLGNKNGEELHPWYPSPPKGSARVTFYPAFQKTKSPE